MFGYSKKNSILIVSLAVTAVLVIIIFIIGIGGVKQVSGFSLGPENNPSYSTDVLSIYGPNYFFPYAEASTYITTPYANYMENFTIYESVDNSTWVQVPVSDTIHYTKIGVVSLNDVNIKIYEKVYFQWDNITVENRTVTINDFADSLDGRFQFNPLPTPQTLVIFTLLMIGVFSFVLQIMDFLYRNKPETESTEIDYLTV